MNGYIVLAASIALQLCLGSIYAWSEFVPALTANKWLTQTQAQLIFGVNIAVFTFSMIFAGKLQCKVGSRVVAFIGGCLFAAGYWLASVSGGSFWLIFIGISLVAGVGVGFGYVCPIATCVKWFPKSKGLVSGLAVAGFGAGAVVLSSLSNYLFARGMCVLDIFRLIALLYGSAIIISALFLSEPKTAAPCDCDKHLALSMAVRDKGFWRFVVGMFSGTFAGLLIIGSLKPIALSWGVRDFYATIAISGFALGNAAGRILWGVLIDKIRSKAILISLLFLAFSVAAMLFSNSNGYIFISISALVGFGFGGCFVVYIAQVVNRYGAQNLAGIYPLIFLAYGFSGLVAPASGGLLYELSGSYKTAIITATTVCAIGAMSQKLLKTKKQPSI